MILSMTGFGRGTAVRNGREITVELRSVNSRYFEYSSRMPRTCSYLDSRLKKQLNERVTRGKVELSLTVQTVDGSKIPVMAYIMAEPRCRQPALPSPYYYRAIQQGFEANGLPVKSLEEAWNRTIDEIWLGKVERPKNGKNPKTRKPER